MYRLIEELYPICRSITGDGVRETLRRVDTVCPLRIEEVPTGTEVFDWKVPREWNIRDAYIALPSGERLVDYKNNNLHVVSYSIPVRATMTLEELRPHLHTLPDHPDWIPYRTSYYSESWGFSVAQRDLESWPEGPYEVVIDSTLGHGHLTYGEAVIPGESSDEVLLYTHICHPSLCNDNLSGISVLAHLARLLTLGERRFTYRIVFAPGTIGAITWLKLNEKHLHRIRHGLVVALVGDSGHLIYKRSRTGLTDTDQAVAYALSQSGREFSVREFAPYGYDERQFGSPGINLPVGRLTRTPNGEYPEYHTSADNLSLVSPRQLAESLMVLCQIVETFECNGRFRNMNPKCEPQLGRRGLYGSMGGLTDIAEYQHALLWVLNMSDGENSLLDIAQRSDIKLSVVHQAAQALLGVGLLRPS
jgi:aminopeptidase-like protein